MYINRILLPEEDNSFLIFGARGTGKSALLEHLYDLPNSLYINLLDPLEEDRFSRNPHELTELVMAMQPASKYVIIDEIQKIPKLLDVVHLLIENKKVTKIFILTGSSARKLKMGGANLLAGRAFVYHLYPFSFTELKSKFDLQSALQWGMLPRIFSLKSDKAKEKFLQTYSQVYLKEEVWGEQLIRKLKPFRRFLEVAAQCNGKVVNYANLSRDVGVDEKTIKNYFTILEDTLLGFMLEPFMHSFRKRLKLSPKFYFIDIGVSRALARMLSLPPLKSTSYYGELFEQFIVTEIIKLANYYKTEYKFSYLMTDNNLEIDLIVERPGEKLLIIEIKSTVAVKLEHLTKFKKLADELANSQAVCFSNDPRKRDINGIMVYPWKDGIGEFFTPL